MATIRRRDDLQEERTIGSFVKELRVSGRYFVGNPSRQEYIRDHKEELDIYLETLRAENWRDADHLESLIKANSKPQPKRQLDTNEMMEMREALLNRKTKPRREITLYDSRPRKAIERIILPIVVIGSIFVAAHVGKKYAEKIEKIIEPYTQKIFQAYNGEFK